MDLSVTKILESINCGSISQIKSQRCLLKQLRPSETLKCKLRSSHQNQLLKRSLQKKRQLKQQLRQQKRTKESQLLLPKKSRKKLLKSNMSLLHQIIWIAFSMMRIFFQPKALVLL
jgi:hypothetical protein